MFFKFYKDIRWQEERGEKKVDCIRNLPRLFKLSIQRWASLLLSSVNMNRQQVSHLEMNLVADRHRRLCYLIQCESDILADMRLPEILLHELS
jgi:hypothetical protein